MTHRGCARGIILPIVLVIFMLLGMLAIGFSFSTRAEYSALGAQAQMDQAQACAVSGIESVCLLLRQKFAEQQYWYDRSDVFMDQPVQLETDRLDNKTVWRYSLVGHNFDSQEVPRFGVTDEASKLNINVASRNQLMRLPNMTSDLVAALMDWREANDSARQGGAKDEYYMTLNQPYRCKKAPFDTIEELLLVKGFTGAIVFGEDMNRNGILDPNENDGRKSLPIDNNDGILDCGLYPYITVYSREPEVTDSDPYQPRMNILQWPDFLVKPMLEKLVQEGKLRPEVVSFIAQAKQAHADFSRSPAMLLGKLAIPAKKTQRHSRRTGPRSDNTTPFGSDNMTQPGSDNETQPGSDNETQSGSDNETASGSDNQTQQYLQSPLTVDDMDAVCDYLTTGYKMSSDGFVYGRINVNTAPRTVLATIGWLNETEIDGIISMRKRLDPQATKTIAWLVKQNVLSVQKFREVACLFTARSYQFTIEALGYSDRQALQARIQAIVELRLPRIQYIYWRDLTSLGRAYNVAEFGEIKSAIQR